MAGMVTSRDALYPILLGWQRSRSAACNAMDTFDSELMPRPVENEARGNAVVESNVMQFDRTFLSNRVQITTNDVTMIGSGTLARFTPTEVEEFRQIGLDLSKVRHQADIEQEVSRWVNTLADERFDVLEKIASEMAKAKGVKLPPKLTAVPS
jgi:hypothetical protein